MKKATKKLKLSRETVRSLSSSQLLVVDGGASNRCEPTALWTCTWGSNCPEYC